MCAFCFSLSVTSLSILSLFFLWPRDFAGFIAAVRSFSPSPFSLKVLSVEKSRYNSASASAVFFFFAVVILELAPEPNTL
jgi:hypothetical protein